MFDLPVEPRRQGAKSIDKSLGYKIDIFEKLKEDFDKGLFGWIGPFEEFALGYITFASILHAEVDGVASPVGSFVIGESSTGKSQFLESIALAIPPEKIINLTSASAKALIYECRTNPYYLNGKVVFVEELSGLKNPEIQYLLRVLLTKGYAMHTTVLSGEAEKIEIYGAISLQSTGLTTDILRDDTMNRLVIFESDSSAEKTASVIEEIKSRYSRPAIKKEVDFSLYHDFFGSLTPRPVVIPYIDRISFDSSRFETRRASKIFLDLLSTVALLNQRRRKIDSAGNIVSEPEDLDLLLSFSKKKKSEPSFTLSPSQDAVYSAIQRLSCADGFTYQDILSQNPHDGDGKTYELSSIKKAVSKLKELGLLEVVRLGRPVILASKNQRYNSRFNVQLAVKEFESRLDENL